jgi:hypothetical protein
MLYHNSQWSIDVHDMSTFNISLVILKDENAIFNIDDDIFLNIRFPNELATVCS